MALCGMMTLSSCTSADMHFDTSDLQAKLMQDLTDMIQQYDFDHILTETVDKTAENVIAKERAAKPTVQELLDQLQVALKEQKSDLWPNAPMKDSEMLEHINIEFNLNDGIVTAETMARDHHGIPKYEYVYDTNTDNTVEIVKPDYVEEPVQQTASASS